MRKSELDIFIQNWSNGFSKTFKYIREFYPTDYVAIKKHNDTMFEIVESTAKEFKEVDQEKFLDMLVKEELVYLENYNSFTSLVNLKTDGCSCGAWILGPNTGHEHNCDKLKYNGWKYS